MKEMEWYLGKTYSDNCHPAIMTETAAKLPDPEMPTITELGTERPKIDGEMTYIEKNNINEAIRQKLRKKDVYESDMHKIYNMIVGQTNEQIQEKAALRPIGPLLTRLRMSLNDTTRLTPKVVQKTSFLVALMIKSSHPPTLISQIIMTTMALKLTLP